MDEDSHVNTWSFRELLYLIPVAAGNATGVKTVLLGSDHDVEPLSPAGTAGSHRRPSTR
jgi:hypothetical protein